MLGCEAGVELLAAAEPPLCFADPPYRNGPVVLPLVPVDSLDLGRALEVPNLGMPVDCGLGMDAGDEPFAWTSVIPAPLRTL